MISTEISPYSIGILCLTAFLTLSLSHWWLHKKVFSSHKKPIPSPPELPILGTHLHLAFKHLASPKAHEFFIDMHKKYGPVVALRLPVGKLVLISNPIQIRRMYASPEFCRNEIMQQAGRGLFEHALFSLPSGPDWQRHRKLLQPVFAPANLRSAALCAQEIYHSLFGEWKNILTKGNSQECIRVQFSKAAKAVVIDTTGTVAFSHNFDAVKTYLDGKECEGIKPLVDMMRMMQKRTGIPYPLWFLFGVAENGPEAIGMRQKIETLLKSIIDRKKAAFSSDKEELSDRGIVKDDTVNLKWDLDIMDRLLLGADSNGDKFSEKEIMDECIGFFLAGSDSTSRTLEALFMNLGRRRDILDKVVAEIDTILSQLGPGPVQLSDLSKFEYLENVIKESMRTDPVVGTIPRCSAQEVDVQGYTFPKNTIFFLDINVANQDPAFWKDPSSFNPDRFQNPEECKAFIPFADGPNACIGQKLAMLQLKYFDFEIVPEQSFEKESVLTLGLAHPLELLVSLRE